MSSRRAVLTEKLRHELAPKRGYGEKLVLAARAAFQRVLGRAALREPTPPMYPGALRMDERELEAATAAVRDVLERRRLFRHWGPERRLLETSRVAELEHAFARRVGTSAAVAVSSGTTALQCGLVGLGVGPGDEVIVPSYAWFTVCSAVLATGAVPVLAEIDDSLTLDPGDLERRLSPHTKAVIPVHMRGAPCDMEAVLAFARRHDLRVLEDAAQAIGGSYRGRPLGSLGDAGAFSLQFNKIVTTGEGGLLATSAPEVHRRAEILHDVTAASRRRLDASGFLPGLNFRMTELQGALALVQLERLDDLLAAMRGHKRRLVEAVSAPFAAKGVELRRLHDAAGDTAVALVFFLPEAERAGAVERALIAEGVPAQRLYRDLAQFPDDQVDLHVFTTWFPVLDRSSWSARGEPWASHPREVRQGADACPRTLDLLRRAIQVDVSPDLSPEQVDGLAAGLEKVVERLV